MAQNRASSKRAPRGGADDANNSANQAPLFTLDRARHAIVYIQLIVRDIVKAHADMISVQAALQAAIPGAQRDAQQLALAKSLERIHSLDDELNSAGVRVRDHATGVVEFPAKHKRQPASLIWKLGQQDIDFVRIDDTATTIPIALLEE
jgi:hypothetical protein